MILIPDEVRNRVVLQALLYLHLHLHIALIIFLKQRPFVRRVVRQVPGPTTVAFRRLAGAAEVLNQILAFFEFLLFKAEDRTDLFQSQRQAVVGSPNQCAFP